MNTVHPVIKKMFCLDGQTLLLGVSVLLNHYNLKVRVRAEVLNAIHNAPRKGESGKPIAVKRMNWTILHSANVDFKYTVIIPNLFLHKPMGKGEDWMHLFKASTPWNIFPMVPPLININFNLSTNAFWLYCISVERNYIIDLHPILPILLHCKLSLS